MTAPPLRWPKSPLRTDTALESAGLRLLVTDLLVVGLRGWGRPA